jgi:hypothetical protein
MLADRAAAQTAPGADAVASTPAPDDAAPPQDLPRKKKRDLLIAPVPFSSATTGVGLAAGAVLFYNPNDAPHQWVTGGGIVWTSRGTKGVAAFHSMSLHDDRIRISAIASYFDAVDRYYGIGAAAGDRGSAIDLRNAKTNLQITGQLQAFRHGYVGISYRLLDTNARPDTASPTTPAPPGAQLNSTLSMFGPRLAFDTRDSETRPQRGMNLTATWLFGTSAFGDSFEHNKLSLAGSLYRPFSSTTVFAVNATLCSARGTVPYYDLCLFGADNALRGYLTGRYRDRASWSAQGEVRQDITGRWGAVGFFGFGKIAPSVGDILGHGAVLPAAGLGLRYRPFKTNDVRVRLDVALGKNESGLYLGIGEAF